MNALATAINHYGITGAPAEIVAALDTDVELSRDTQRWTYAGLVKRFGPQIVGQIDEGLKQIPGMDWVRLALAAGGLDFSDETTQAGLDSLVEVFGAETVAALKAIGVVQGKRWQKIGLSGLPTEADVEAALRQLEMTAWANTLWSSVVLPAIASGATRDEVKAAIAEQG